MKRTYQPKKLKTLRKRGFRARMETPGGVRVIKRRKAKGRSVVTVSDEYRIKDKKPNHRVR